VGGREIERRETGVGLVSLLFSVTIFPAVSGDGEWWVCFHISTIVER
jgi:hypothetical protein